MYRLLFYCLPALLLAACESSSGPTSPTPSPARFTTLSPASHVIITHLGTLPGGYSSHAFDINGQGHVVGSSSTPSGTRAFLWDPIGGMQDLGTLPGGNYSVALAINDLGQVAGYSETSSGNHAFLWDPIGGMQDLGTLPGMYGSHANAINDLGQVAGWSYSMSVHRAFLWESGVMTDLGTLPGGFNGAAYGINDLGQVVGWSQTFSGQHAFLWDPIGGMQDLGGAWAHGINDQGHVVGSSSTPSGTRALLWENGLMTYLGTLPGDSYSVAYGINDQGQVVGASKAPPGSHATLWTITVANPEQQIDHLIDLVTEFELNAGIERALSATLEVAKANLERGNPNAALHDMNAFMVQLNAMRGKQITDQQADAFMAWANSIITAIEALIA